MDLELIACLRADLQTADYHTRSVAGLLGAVADESRQRGVFAPAHRVLAERDRSPLATIVRVFLLGEAGTMGDLDEALPRLRHAGAEQLGLVTRDPESALFHAALSLNPVAIEAAGECTEWWVISDLDDQLRRGPVQPDHVMGVGGATRSLIAQAPAWANGVALDLGTGCGIVALHLARALGTQTGARIVATDISERALTLARANAELNGLADRIEFRRGSLFEPVAGERFELVLSNPPFVISPQNTSGEHVDRYEYRDGGMRGDDLVASVVSEAPRHLVEGGTLLCLANWECPWGVDGLERVREWVTRSEDQLGRFGTWVIERDRVDPAQYAETWVRDGGVRPGTAECESLMSEWLEDFAARQIVAIGLGSIRLQRLDPDYPPNAPAPVRLERAGGTFSAATGHALNEAFEAAIRVTQMSDVQLLEAHWILDSEVIEERQHRPGEEAPRAITLVTSRGIERRITADPMLAAAVGACDGDLTLGQIVDALATLLEVEVSAAAEALTLGVRELVWMGVLSPVC